MVGSVIASATNYEFYYIEVLTPLQGVCIREKSQAPRRVTPSPGEDEIEDKRFVLFLFS